MIANLVETTTTKIEQLASVCWSEVSASEFPGVLRQIEELSRRLDAAGAAGAAESAARAERAGRSISSAATALGKDLGLTAGQCRARIDAGRREGSPAMDAHRQGRITSGQERAIGEAVAELPEGTPEEASRDFSRHLTELAEAGASVRALIAAAARELAKVDPGRLERIEEQQQRRRELRSHRAGTDGLSSVGITCEPRLQALLAAVVARFGGPGQCISAPADPITGESADQGSLAADDTRTAGQRAYDALCHVLSMGLAVETRRDPRRGRHRGAVDRRAARCGRGGRPGWVGTDRRGCAVERRAGRIASRQQVLVPVSAVGRTRGTAPHRCRPRWPSATGQRDPTARPLRGPRRMYPPGMRTIRGRMSGPPRGGLGRGRPDHRGEPGPGLPDPPWLDR